MAYDHQQLFGIDRHPCATPVRIIGIPEHALRSPVGCRPDDPSPRVRAVEQGKCHQIADASVLLPVTRRPTHVSHRRSGNCPCGKRLCARDHRRGRGQGLHRFQMCQRSAESFVIRRPLRRPTRPLAPLALSPRAALALTTRLRARFRTKAADMSIVSDLPSVRAVRGGGIGTPGVQGKLPCRRRPFALSLGPFGPVTGLGSGPVARVANLWRCARPPGAPA